MWKLAIKVNGSIHSLIVILKSIIFYKILKFQIVINIEAMHLSKLKNYHFGWREAGWGGSGIGGNFISGIIFIKEGFGGGINPCLIPPFANGI